MKYIVAFLVLALIILHQDYWQWHRSDIVFGFVPYSLAYHMGVSIATAAVWIFTVSFCWPTNKDGDSHSGDSNQGTSE